MFPTSTPPAASAKRILFGDEEEHLPTSLESMEITEFAAELEAPVVSRLTANRF